MIIYPDILIEELNLKDANKHAISID